MTSEPAPVPDIRLPDDLRPSDGRFGCGPSKVRPEAVGALAGVSTTYLGTSHRQPTVKSMVGRLRSGLAELFSLPDGYEVVLGNGGAAFFWDVAAFSLVRSRSQHLVFGEFSSSFAKTVAAAPHLDGAEVIESAPGNRPYLRPAAGIDVYALTQNETSTGVSAEVRRPAAADGADPDSLVLVDATSAAGGMAVDPAEFDVYYFSPQKCFGADGGLWLALLSPAAIARTDGVASTGRWMPSSLSLGVALANSRLDQTYNTPGLATIFLMVDQVEWMLANGGLPWCASRCATSAGTVYRWAEASDFARPFVADPADRSPVVATVDLDDSVDAGVLCKLLRANGIVDTEAYRKLGRNQIRVALFPNVDPADAATLTAAIDHIAAALV